MVTSYVETSYRRKEKGRDGSDKKTRKKSRKLLDELKDRRGYSHLKEEALDRTMYVGIVLEEALNLSSERILNFIHIYIYTDTHTHTYIYILT